MYKIAICDDIKNHIEYMKKMILLSGFTKENTVFDEFLSGEELLTHIREMNVTYDLLILDMQLGELNGFETAQAFRLCSPDCVLVFYSGTTRVEERTLEVEAYRYLLKEYTDERMIFELKKIYEKVTKEKEDLFIPVKCNGKRLELSIKEVAFIEKAKRGCKLHINKTADSYRKDLIFITELHLEELYNKLKGFHFARAHSSYIVNMKHLDIPGTTKKSLKLNDGTELAISRSKEKTFEESIANYIGSKY